MVHTVHSVITLVLLAQARGEAPPPPYGSSVLVPGNSNAHFAITDPAHPLYFPSAPTKYESPQQLKDFLKATERVPVSKWSDEQLQSLYNELEEGICKIMVLHKGWHKLPVRILTVTNTRVYRTEGPARAHLVRMTTNDDGPRGVQGEGRFNLVTGAVTLGIDPEVEAMHSLAENLAELPEFALDDLQVVSVLDSSKLQEGMGQLEDEGIKLETCKDERYPGLACVFTVYLYEAKVSGLPAGEFSTTNPATGAINRWAWEDPVETERAKWLPVTTIIMDLDNTLNEHQDTLLEANRDTLLRFMVEKLKFKDEAAALETIAPYLATYPEAFLKSLLMAETDGKFPDKKVLIGGPKGQLFTGFGEYVVETTPWGWLHEASLQLKRGLEACAAARLKLVGFSNMPHAYAVQFLARLGLSDLFPSDKPWMEPRTFGIEDVLPDVKPEKRAFDRVLRQVMSDPYETVYVDDDLVNLRVAKRIGMRTVLVGASDPAEKSDAAVDVAIEHIELLFRALPLLGYEGECAEAGGLPEGDELATYLSKREFPPECTPDDRIGRRRALSAAGAAGDATPDGASEAACSTSFCDSEQAWFETWQRRFECWFVGLPLTKQTQLGSCMGALALHVGSRLEVAWRAAQMALKRPLPVSSPAARLPEGCEWLSQETSLGLPAFPPFPVDNEFKLPPLPRLLPMWDVLRQLQSLMHEQEPQQAFELAHMFRSSASTADKSWAITSVAGASAGLATGLILSTWLALRRRRCHGERCITRAS